MAFIQTAFIQTSDTLSATNASSASTEPNQDFKTDAPTNRSPEEQTPLPHLDLPPLPLKRPLLMVGQGTRNAKGRQDLLD